MRNKVDDEQDIIDYINNVEYQDVVEIIEKVFNKENIVNAYSLFALT